MKTDTLFPLGKKIARGLFWIVGLLWSHHAAWARFEPDPDDAGLKLPPGFHAFVVADNLGKLEFMTVSSNGDIYIRKRDRGVVVLRCANGDGRAELINLFGDDSGGTGIAWRNGWIYYSTQSDVYRGQLNGVDLIPQKKPERIVTGLPPEIVQEGHTLAFDPEGNLYAEVGFPSNASAENDRSPGAKGIDPSPMFQTHGGFWKFKSEVKDQTQKDGIRWGTGFSKVLAIAWHPISKVFFAVPRSRNQLHNVDPEHFSPEQNAELPAEEMHILSEKSDFGWPFTYYDPFQKARMLAPEFGGDGKKRDDSGKYEAPLVTFPAHWSPRQMAIYTGTQFPEKYRNGAFIAFHGSWDRAPLPQAGYNVAFVPFNSHGMPVGNYEVFADGFTGKPVVYSPIEAKFRPCGLAVGPDGSLFVSDSEHGRVWCIYYAEGQSGKVVQVADFSDLVHKPAAEPNKHLSPGGNLYEKNCAICHQTTGEGIPGVIPPLLGSKMVLGDPSPLISMILIGPHGGEDASRSQDIRAMHSFMSLKDDEVAGILTYVRKEFGKGAAAINEQTVSQVRMAQHLKHTQYQ